ELHLLHLWCFFSCFGFFVFFFFSSRRRHTRFSRDWSSDVCSSDLLFVVGGEVAVLLVDRLEHADDFAVAAAKRNRDQALRRVARSEERRVGKECRSRWSPQH